MKSADRRRASDEQKDEFSVALQELNHAIGQLTKIVTNVKRISDQMAPTEVINKIPLSSKIIH